MLDVPVWTSAKAAKNKTDRRMVGVVCCEHVGGKRG